MTKEINQKNVIILFVLFALLGSIFSLSIYYDYYSTDKIDISGFTSEHMLFSIDSIDDNAGNEMITIKGWAAKKNEDLKIVKTYVALKNIKTSEVLRINTIKEERPDVTSYYNNESNYNHSGFISVFNKNSIKKSGKYEVCILYLSDNNKKFISTGKYLEID
ncbi:hypothetical protein FDE76_01080 [Clostridium botulinum]|uniref:Uncharacterized protein n=1 Tax=Clostridium botulinum (strain Eklund 17B / Type B) TaxID=935198 RepID=B2TQH3_CLOBB|nr:hypothetical protein [Clostridium sp. M14]ACD24271.1 hypothetical protein CLL_A3244 [Clostridium botulinum B str. Eklund 17B (NRP)]MBN1046677.1 hypothetical protein [Clostridium botulinum]MBN1053368.1 hypothetical protein [Clostridium botulinum]MBY6975609.1 hypothetical protein [Clostridium botulinum]MBY7001158.1 hypothetical protein [Clostridium botulinum]